MSLSAYPAGPEYAIARALEAAADTGADLDVIGFMYTNAIKVKLSQPGTGIVYGKHQASAPGEPPAADTGIYRASWTATRAGQAVSMGPQLPQVEHPRHLGTWLEFGTSRMEPRPHARPTSAALAPGIPKVFAKGIEARQRAAVRGGR